MDEVPEEVFHIIKVGSESCVLITMEVSMQSTFQLDAGAECNLLSPKDYHRVTGDVALAQVKRCSHKFIKTYTNEQYKILGSTAFPLWCHGPVQLILPHCYHTAHILNWDPSQLMATIAPQIPVISRMPPA